MITTEPSKSSRAFLRKRDARTDELKRALPKSKKARARLFDIGATTPLIDKASVVAQYRARQG